MDVVVRLLAMFTALFTVGGVAAFAAPVSAPPVVDTRPVFEAPQEASYRVSAPLQPRYPTVPRGAKCPQWWPSAIEAGWRWAEMPTVDFIIHRESRCQTDAHNTTLNRDGSTDLGLMQINDRSWCLPNRWNPYGWLQAQGIIDTCGDLFDPATNLRAARAIYEYAERTSGRGFGPWGK